MAQQTYVCDWCIKAYRRSRFNELDVPGKLLLCTRCYRYAAGFLASYSGMVSAWPQRADKAIARTSMEQ